MCASLFVFGKESDFVNHCPSYVHSLTPAELHRYLKDASNKFQRVRAGSVCAERAFCLHTRAHAHHVNVVCLCSTCT